jgi:O-antigen ligase
LFSEATSPHNEYLRVLAETGLIGLALFVWIVFAVVSFSLKMYQALVDPFFKSLALGALGVSVAFVLLCVTDNPLVYHSVSIYFWALLALVEVGRRIEKPDATPESLAKAGHSPTPGSQGTNLQESMLSTSLTSPNDIGGE